MKEKSKDELRHADKKDRVTLDNVAVLRQMQSIGLFTDLKDEDVSSSTYIDELLYPFDAEEAELPPAVLGEIQKDPGKGRFAIAPKIGAIWLMTAIQDENKVPRFNLISNVTGYSIKALNLFWREKEKWLEYMDHFMNTSLEVIKMNFVVALLRSSNALMMVDYNRLAKSTDPRDHSNLLKMTEGLATRVAMSDALLAAIRIPGETEEIEGIGGILPVAPTEEEEDDTDELENNSSEE